MKYDDFLAKLGITRTTEGKGKGVRCNIAFYMYPDGHSNLYMLNNGGKWIMSNNEPVSAPANDKLETVNIFIDILYQMFKASRKNSRKGSIRNG